MHLALRRYAEPPRDVFQYFCLGALVAVLVLATIFERLDEVEDQEAKAATTVRAYAYEAFPAWVVDHPDLACPADRAQLDVYLGGSSGFDPWGYPYAVACDPGGMLVAWSVGPDGVYRSADDVSSR